MAEGRARREHVSSPLEDGAGLARHLDVLAGPDDGERQAAPGAARDRCPRAPAGSERVELDTPRKPRPSTAARRRAGERSPTPPVNTSASSPPRLAVIAAIEPQTMAVDRERELRVAVAATAAREHVAHVRRSGQPEQSRSALERMLDVCRVDPRRRISQSTRPGSTLPERVAITMPSSGVKPMVVSTERPSRTAHSDAPAPRWQVTTRSAAASRPSIAAPRRAA